MPGATSAQFPDKLEFLFAPARYKVLYGGRGGAKSWGIARALLICGARSPLRILCAREFQNSIAESVHELLSAQVHELGLDTFYDVQTALIRGVNGTEFSFAGLRHNISKIRSFEGADRVWVEEAQSVSKSSWDALIPTIRKDGSEIWLSFNPELDDDETYRRFVTNPPPGAVVQKLNYTDNPWFPAVLEAERVHMQATRPDDYLTVWEGHCRVALEGAIYAEELRAATADERITRVPYVLGKPVDTFWDLGRADYTSIWFVQVVGFQYRVIDFYQDNRKHLSHFLKVLQERPYVYGTDHLPHDAEDELLGQEKTIAGQARVAGRRVSIVPRMGIANGINAARTIFPACYFDAERCADGLQSLRHYRYGVDTDTGKTTREPLHDWSSHAADAWRYFAVAHKDNQQSRPLNIKRRYVT